MAEASLALSAPARGRNTPLRDVAALKQECLAPLSIWAALPGGSPNRQKVYRQPIELCGRLDASSIAEEVGHG